MVLRKKLNKYKVRLCAFRNELNGQIAEKYYVVHQIIDTAGAYLSVYLMGHLHKIPATITEASNIPLDVVYRIAKFSYGLPASGHPNYQA